MSSDILSKLPVTVRKMWLVGIIVSVLLTLCGLIFSIYPPSIRMVMLALHRASGITLLLLLPIATWHLLDLFGRKNFCRHFVACLYHAGFFTKNMGNTNHSVSLCGLTGFL